MSRHEIPAKDPNHKVIVGWDAPLLTFFGQVIDRRKERDKPDYKIIKWVGTNYREIPTVRLLQNSLQPFAKFDEALWAKLGADRTAPKHNGRAKA